MLSKNSPLLGEKNVANIANTRFKPSSCQLASKYSVFAAYFLRVGQMLFSVN
jgi:hypothetical protein